MSAKKKTHHEPEQAEKETKETAQSNEEAIDQVQLWKDRFARVSADLENFKRRVEKERTHWMQVAQADLMLDLLSIVDDFERALQQGDTQDLAPEMKTWLNGFTMIGQSLFKMLQKYGLQEITEQKNFDPNLHEAMAQIESPVHESGQIVEVLQKGYRLNDQILRPAKVTVAK